VNRELFDLLLLVDAVLPKEEHGRELLATRLEDAAVDGIPIEDAQGG